MSCFFLKNGGDDEHHFHHQHKRVKKKMGMNRREFSDYYGIPYRTVQDWESREKRTSRVFAQAFKVQSRD